MKIELFSDMICPFCYIGKRRLDTALGEIENADRIDIVHRSFQLDPSAAKVAGERLPEREVRFHGISLAEAKQRLKMVADMAASDGLVYDLDNALPVRTWDAHRLVHYASEQGKGNDMVESLLRGYAVEGRSLADHDVLAELAVGVGLDRSAVHEMLASDRYGDAVQADLARARELGIGGVPSIVVDERMMIPGVESPKQIANALRRAMA